jgi:HD-GYP domain-containing protein (c-di-GMP phosphodiesterase class II)
MKLPKISITTNIILVFGFFFVLFSSLFIYLSNHYSHKLAEDATQKTFTLLSRNIMSNVSGDYNEIRRVIGMIAADKRSTLPIVAGQIHPLYKTMKFILEEHPALTKIYVADADANMFEVMKRNNMYVVSVISNGEKTLFLYDKSDVLLSKRSEKSDFNLKKEPWYIKAKKTKKMIFTKPYLFDHPHVVGVTFARQMGRNLFGIDMSLESFESYLESLASRNAQILLYSRELGRVYASSAHLKMQKLPLPLKRAIEKKEFNKLHLITIEGKKYYLLLSEMDAINKDIIISYVSQKSILQPYLQQIKEMFLYIILVILLFIPFIVLFSRFLTKPIGRLIKENRHIKERNFERVERIATFVKEFDELSESQYEMAHEIQAYQKSQEELLNSIIKLIAGAIDVKSLYTGGHCKRVPEIAKMLLEKANEEQGAFKEFHFDSEDEWRAFEIGSWLHDCGKLTTPEYVMDKATKLETIYNRIHEIRTRFEVLLRDAKIAEYEMILAGKDTTEAAALYERTKQELMDDFAFIAKVNIGGEFLNEADKERIKKIGSREWMRNFDAAIGISEEEQARLTETDRQMPQLQKLLEDRASHYIKRVNFDAEAYKQEGFKLEVPEYAYNLGELYNLCVERGTLSEEERYKIQEHVIMTIKMLEEIPFPTELQNVPKYAGTHHETLIGTGYPRRLTADALSIPERVMAIADIFEALTASDRPYKKAKTVSEALKIMSFMVKDQHIDANLFKLFVEKKIYLRYAERFLKKEQIDE